MATTGPTTPATIRALVSQKLDEWFSQAPNLLAGSMPDRMSDPIPTYDIDLERLDSDSEDLPIRHRGWRVLLLSPLGDARAADVWEGRQEPRFARVVRGAGVDRMVEAARAAGDPAAGSPAAMIVSPEPGSIRLLDCDPLKVAAIWVGGEGGFIHPYLGLESRPFTVKKFREALAERLERVKGQFDVKRPGDGETMR